MKTLVSLEVNFVSSRYSLEHRIYPNADAPEKHIIVIAKSQQFCRLIANELELCESLDAAHEVAGKFDHDASWLAIMFSGRHLAVMNNSDMVLYHEQAGKISCLTDPLFDFTHRLTWQSREDSVVRTISRGIVNLDDVLRIEENGLNLGTIVVRYLEELYDGAKQIDVERFDSPVEPLRSRWAFLIMAAIIVMAILGLTAGFTQSKWRNLILRQDHNENSQTSTTSTTSILPLLQTRTVADLDGVMGKWLLVSQGNWYVSDGRYLYTKTGKSSMGETKGLFAGKLWYIDALWFLEYKDGMVHLSSNKGNRVSLSGTNRSDFDTIIDFTATTNGQSVTLYVLMSNEVKVYEGVNYLSFRKSLPLATDFLVQKTISREPFRFIANRGEELAVFSIESGKVKELGSVKGESAIAIGNEVYTIDERVLHTEAKDFQTPFAAADMSALDGSFVLLRQPALLVQIEI